MHSIEYIEKAIETAYEEGDEESRHYWLGYLEAVKDSNKETKGD